ncbi:M48 family metallopeptidase [Nonomuraea jiangxiensis]|uniref:Zn-dependent protease with chaperone function n=1 Tax=Nonomuraea jiangxiensis TaxID=633440 RepID=A0A1G9EF49_9ACTN|nr:M48 family metallopeptidase [Nonomuraea jiangxiensis]SDK74780.1 Zn-dependent protease with chaperone function [Nonomuraea jiangxiensis]
MSRTTGYVLAFVIHLCAPAFLVGGIYLVTRLTIGGILFGLVALDLAWLRRPRPVPFPASAVPLTRSDAPHLYALIDHIGVELGAPRTDLIAVSGVVNASFRTYGRRRSRLVEIGYPLWLILTPQERVSLLAHKMAHSRNGDARHGLVVGSALYSLHVLRMVTSFGWQPGDGVSALITECALAILGVPVRILIFLLELLLNRSSQHAEHRADELQAQIAGSAATASLLDTLTTRTQAARSFLKSSAVAVGTGNLWTALQSQMDTLSPTELERHRELARVEKTRLDSTHPPTYLRMQRVLALPYPEPRVSAADMEQIETELAKAAGRVAQSLRENAQSALYR